MEAAVVLPVDPAGGGVIDIGDGLVGPRVEHGGADALGLVQPVDGFHQGIVVGVTDGAIGDGDPFQLEARALVEAALADPPIAAIATWESLSAMSRSLSAAVCW